MYMLIWLKLTIYIDNMYTKLHENVFFLRVDFDELEIYILEKMPHRIS